MKISFSFLSAFFLLILFIGCQTDVPAPKEALPPDLPETPYDYKEFNAVLNSTMNNLKEDIDNDLATLGRVLFYDRHLSQNNSTSCGSCHIQHLGFADGKQFSTGLNGKTTTRNSMSLSNMVLQNGFFWDVRAWDLEKQVMMPIENHIEMGVEMLSSLPEKLDNLSYYPELFENVYGTPEITETGIAAALAHFLESMISMDSKFDRGSISNYENFTAKELLGKELFNGKAKCQSCHSFITLGGWGTANIGLDLNYEDNGRGNGRFKIPSLKNIAETAPYMHDGRFETLEEVIDHYNEGIKSHPSLSWVLRDFNGAVKLELTELEKSALVAFLQTLSDEGYMSDPKYSDPF